MNELDDRIDEVDDFDDERDQVERTTPIVCPDCALEAALVQRVNAGAADTCGHIEFLNVYEASRHYGGPEEGGWYYDAGEPVLSVPVVLNHPDVRDPSNAHVYELWEKLRKVFPRTGKRSSVLGGDDWDVQLQAKPAKAFPEHVPHYE